MGRTSGYDARIRPNFKGKKHPSTKFPPCLLFWVAHYLASTQWPALRKEAGSPRLDLLAQKEPLFPIACGSVCCQSFPSSGLIWSSERDFWNLGSAFWNALPMGCALLPLGPPVNVTCNIFINSFGSVTETTMVRGLPIPHFHSSVNGRSSPDRKHFLSVVLFLLCDHSLNPGSLSWWLRGYC